MNSVKGIKIAVASGKGGTGKTMVATSLAASLEPEHQIQFLDCDVEAPNGHLFLKPVFDREIPAAIYVPEIDTERCTLCGECVKGCTFHALAKVADQILLFPQLCHGCGSCTLLCPENAIIEQPRKVGVLRQGKTEMGTTYLMGELTVSEPMPTPIIHQLKALSVGSQEITILDSPPGASCAVVETLHDADYVILVTEPTPFGLHDLAQMLGILEKIGLPGGIIVNRAGIGDDQVQQFVRSKCYPILLEIPYQRSIAAGLARGDLLVRISPMYRSVFSALFNHIQVSLGRKADSA